MTEQVLRNWKDIDIGAALLNLAMEHMSDKAVGIAGQGLKNLNAKTGRPIGLGTGPAL